MTSKEIRQKYLEYMRNKRHAIIPSASLLPENDSSTLFISSGMQPLVPYLMGEKHPAGVRLADSQKSFRSGDIEEVGDNRHNTFFEMLGNWSLGDYFKDEQLAWIFDFAVGELEFDPKRLYVSVYRGNKEIGIEKDAESVRIWKDLFKKVGIKAKDIDMAEENGMQGGRIFYYDDDKNWWSRSGAPANMPEGEIGGPDSEIFYDLGADLGRHENSKWKDQPCHINCDCGRFIEFGNSVFMEFIKIKLATTNGDHANDIKYGFEKMSQKNVDFGGGLERMAMIAQGKDNVFETDLFRNIINKIRLLSGKEYKDNIKSFEVIADHIKAASFIMGDDKGITPSNVDQGYIVRRLIRRAIRYGRQLGIEPEDETWTKEVAKIVIHDYYNIYPELGRNVNFVIEEFKKEEKKFNKTLERGLKEFEKITDNKKQIAGVDAFNLYQTYGFPIEMTEELAEENDLKVDLDGFNKEFRKHQALSRTAAAGKFKGGLADQSEDTMKLHTAAHLLLASLRKVLGKHVVQKGSNITSARLRFDFSHGAKMTDEEKSQVEDMVNEIIQKNLPITCEEMNLEMAKKKGAMGVFDSKYDEKVKVYKVGDDKDVFSYEICGGPHVERTGILGKFKIKKEGSSSSGVRRIKAVLE